MNTLAAGLSFVDLNFQRVPRVIATAVVHGPGGVALIDPGPTSTLPSLRVQLERAGLSIADVSALLLTHIHLDHAGAAGTLVRENPRIKVYVHENGAPHMANPDKLLASATRLYGDAMDRLWGEFLPVAAQSMIVLKGGESVEEGGRRFEVAYTPGHASHHVSYFDRSSGLAFVGDTAGVKVVANGYVLPPTPPPDIDLDLWRASVARIQQWHPSALFLTHFGPFTEPSAHLGELVDHLELVGSLAKTALARNVSDDEREEWFVQEIRRELRRRMTESDVQAYQVAGRFDLSWRGLARYWKKKG